MAKMTWLGKLAAAGMLLASAGCVTVGGPFNTSRVPSISVGKTTQDDVEKMFGQPFRTGTDDGDVTWTYTDYHIRLFGPQEARDLFIKFNKNGTVKSYAFNTSD
jgi:outer membrane protein assembly factor BamE (lipoprotein component of BamABCDE complex)